MMHNDKLLLEYDGGRYNGWIRIGKGEGNNTISAKLAEVVKRMTGEEVEIFCGCRTETGVHAYGQVANFKLNRPVEPKELHHYLVRYLPQDIGVISVEEADERFHSQLNARSRTYVYRIDTKDVADVFQRRYMYHVFHKLDLEAMGRAGRLMEGSHDYGAFTSAKRSKSTVREVSEVSLYDDGDSLDITITANDFMHNMARNMVGVLLEVGNGRMKPEEVTRLLEGKSRAELVPAESHGLFLQSVLY
jgi:tRNA pseudouridine38-40 synthase